jgi:hypothetical protein
LISFKVNQVICGGIDGFCLNQLGTKDIRVLQNIVGEAEIAFRLFMEGRLRPGCCCERKKRSFCAWKGEPFGRRM